MKAGGADLFPLGVQWNGFLFRAPRVQRVKAGANQRKRRGEKARAKDGDTGGWQSKRAKAQRSKKAKKQKMKSDDLARGSAGGRFRLHVFRSSGIRL
jgi:hypothetical protein